MVDFYCPFEKLIIELDGEYHNNPETMEKDLERDKRLENLGFTILRFENKLVLDDLDGVLKTISENFKTTKNSPPS